MTASHHFAGQTFSPEHDGQRLSSQFERVLALMSDGKWRTLREICIAVHGASEAGVSARLRELRTKEGGAHEVLRRRRGDPKRGLHEYSVVRADRPAQMKLIGG